MGRKKASWFSAIKRVFVSNTKEKLLHDGSSSENKSKSGSKDKKKWGFGVLRHGDSNSFINPLHREPSSIEKILRDAERELQIPKNYSSEQHQHLPRPAPVQTNLAMLPPSSSEEQRRRRRPPPPPPPPRTPSPVPMAPGVHHKEAIRGSPIISSNNHQTSATKIQAAFRGYMARRSFRALKGLVRLQGVMRGQSIKRQTMNAMKQMQLLVRVQSQIQSRRIQMLDHQAMQRHNLHKIDKELESSLGKWTTTLPSDTEEWDDSLLTKEEEEARLQRKVDAVIKRERALAYAYSNQLWKATPKSAKAALVEIRSGGLPWWWNWVERELPGYPSEIHAAMHTRVDHLSHDLTPPRRRPHHSDSPNLQGPPSTDYSKQLPTRLGGFDNLTETLTPRSSKSAITANPKYAPLILSNRGATTTTTTNTSSTAAVMNHVKPRRTGATTELSLDDVPLRDDASLTSCPPFSVPNYMVPTVSAKAKVRANNPKERETMVSSSHGRRRRLSFPLTQSIGSLRWNKVFSTKDSSSHRMLEKNQTLQSIGNLSVDSTVSLPVGVGRKPFKRFV
ncbi:protein IQ-DOMAIN 14 [Macadamia integrifolia]|uniref:protein IQ-DOMAIN 14 n=1 Tax=Macadamia integrifolia TaxID=60698 RepID=UPI001C527AF2|nr:protein IQ-DOMAIN 14 [Macadamia integrifolia]XP_042520650.1 protein IQ-DOMAIN 14 [Macadamia integrifolia]XP_042520651.1 protein IQ-DOMAIN 14 [Macadamia integrifolia]